MSRWTPADLAEAMSRNPALRVNRSSAQKQGRGSHPAIKPATEPANAQNSVSTKPHRPQKDYKAALVQQCEIAGLKLEPEFKFHPERKFRADWRVHYGAWEGKRPQKIEYFIPSNVLVEYEGGIFSSGKRGHSSISGIQRDCEKANLAQILGFIVIRVTPKHVVSGEAFNWITDALRRKIADAP